MKKRDIFNSQNKHSKTYNQKKQENNISDEESKNFSQLPQLAQRNRLIVMWFGVIVLCVFVVIAWFYLASKGVILPSFVKQDNEFPEIKNDASQKFSFIKEEFQQSKEGILNLKKQLEASISNDTTINNLKTSLEEKLKLFQTEKDKKITAASGDIVITYPLYDYYVGNPLTITGKGKSSEGKYQIRLKDSKGQNLGLTSSAVEEDVLSPFMSALSYVNSSTETGILEFFTLDKDGEEQISISIPVKFIPDLTNWQEYKSEEWGIAFKYPAEWLKLQTTDIDDLTFFQLNSREKLESDLETKIEIQSDSSSIIRKGNNLLLEDSILINYYRNIDELNKDFSSSETVLDNANLQTFLESNAILAKSKEIFYLNNINLVLLITEDPVPVYFYFAENEDGSIFVVQTKELEKNNLELLNQIIATVNFIEPDMVNWNIHEDTVGDITFRYPTDLAPSDDLGQSSFRTDDPEGFNFYFFTVEPQISDLQQWIQQSSMSIEENIIKSVPANFGDALGGIYYEAIEKTDEEKKAIKTTEKWLEVEINENLPEEETTPETTKNQEEIVAIETVGDSEKNIVEGETETIAENPPSSETTEDKLGKNYGFIFNQFGATYSFRTNSSDFPNTFRRILESIEFVTTPMNTETEEALRQEYLDKYK